jgi:small basic protein (TIGR04137 family)
MSIHKSLVASSKLKRHRNVLTKTERIEILKQQGRWKEGDSVFRLPKVASIAMIKKTKAKKEKV